MRSIFSVIEQYHMIEPGMHVIAGVSGGADSVCLLWALRAYQKETPFALTAVHVEHGLRGEESLADAEFTERLCRELGVECRVVPAQVKRLAQERGLSLEEAGRAERYRIFEEVRLACGADRIAVAHNQNDQAETVLWNLARGSGLEGLSGMRPVRGRIIRPLLFTGRPQIEAILREAGLGWRTDRTNLETDYTRNRIRLSVLPLMERELNAQAQAHIAEAAQKLEQVRAYLEGVTDRAARACIFWEDGDVCLQLPQLRQEEALIRTEVLKRAAGLCAGSLRDLGSVHLQALSALTEMDCGKEISLPGRVRAVRESDRIRFTRAQESAAQPVLEISGPGVYQAGDCRIRVELTEFDPALLPEIMQEKKYTKWFSYDTIKGNIQFRTRKTGDYLVVNRQGGRKKLKDYLIDCKVPRARRDALGLFADGPHVLWIPGYRISEAAKVTEETKLVMKIQLEEGL